MQLATRLPVQSRSGSTRSLRSTTISSPPSTVIFLPTTSSNNNIRIPAVTLAVAVFCMRERSNMSDQIFNDLPDILDASQIASALRISRAGAYNLLSSEDFPTLHIGRRKLVMKNDLIQWLKSHTNTTPKH